MVAPAQSVVGQPGACEELIVSIDRVCLRQTHRKCATDSGMSAARATAKGLPLSCIDTKQHRSEEVQQPAQPCIAAGASRLSFIRLMPLLLLACWGPRCR